MCRNTRAHARTHTLVAGLHRLRSARLFSNGHRETLGYYPLQIKTSSPLNTHTGPAVPCTIVCFHGDRKRLAAMETSTLRSQELFFPLCRWWKLPWRLWKKCVYLCNDERTDTHANTHTNYCKDTAMVCIMWHFSREEIIFLNG